MGIDYSQEIIVGYRILEKDLDEAFVKILAPEAYRYEDRFDSKTGAKLQPEKILAKPSIRQYLFEGVDVTEKVEDDTDALASLVAESCKSEYYAAGDYMCGDKYYYFYPKINSVGGSEDQGRVCFGSSLDYQDAVDQHFKMMQIGLQLKALKLNIEGPHIWNAVTIS